MAVGALEGIVANVAQRLPLQPQVPTNDPVVAAARERRQRKAEEAQMAETITQHPKRTAQFFENDSLAAAIFLRDRGVGKAAVGEFLGRGDPKSQEVLRHFVRLFTVPQPSASPGQQLEWSLRQFLQSFRIPGEAAVISRILEEFAKAFCEGYPGLFANPDVAYILCYSIVLLNVDQHNLGVKKRMTEHEFVRNNRGINEGDDLPQDMLVEIYHAIRENEIRIPDEHWEKWERSSERATALATFTDNAWTVFSQRRSTAPQPVHSPREVTPWDSDVVGGVWGAVVAAEVVLVDALNSVDAPLEGLRQLAQVAAAFNRCEVEDALVIALVTALGKVWAMGHFGHGPQALQVMQAVFSVARTHGGLLRESWKNVVELVLRLHAAGWVSAPVAPKLHRCQADVPPPSPPTANRSLLGYYADYYGTWFSSASDTKEEPSPEEVEAEARVKECVEECDLPSLFTNSGYVDLHFHLTGVN